MDVEQVVREYLPQVIHLSLATCKDNKSWVCEVHFAFDQDLNLYFRSKPSRRHSIEIESNPQVAGNIITQHEIGEKVRGVYFEGIAEKLSDIDETNPAYLEYCKRFDRNEEILEEAKAPDGHAFYKISVKSFYLFDGRESNPGKKYELAWNR